jgi:hypothetical protein
MIAPAPASAATTATPEPEPEPEPEPKKRTKYDELVEVLVDGLFEVMMTEPHPLPVRKTQRRGR